MTVSLTDRTWQDLTRINRKVNGDIWPEDDEKHYGRAEYWTIPTDGYGDCDDYAVTKRKTLIDAGFPLPALRLAVVYSPQAGRHAVLTVKTDKGDLVLDNLRDDIVPWDAAGFVWIERQAASDPMKWVSLQRVMVAQTELQTAGTAPNR
jgi:predicted transglutaminase-like cysteine proteinase